MLKNDVPWIGFRRQQLCRHILRLGLNVVLTGVKVLADFDVYNRPAIAAYLIRIL